MFIKLFPSSAIIIFIGSLVDDIPSQNAYQEPSTLSLQHNFIPFVFPTYIHSQISLPDQ
jgi:hypothetical protein